MAKTKQTDPQEDPQDMQDAQAQTPASPPKTSNAPQEHNNPDA